MKIFRVLYILLLSFLLIKPLRAQDQFNVELLNSTFRDVYNNLTPFSSVSYKLDITVKLDNSVLNVYKADVFEVLDKDAHYALYTFGNKNVLFTYNDISGIERFWFGRVDNLPEVLSNQVDQTLLDTSITYSSLLINPSWLNLPFSLKEDSGFKVIQTYNKNLYSSFSKTEFYLNKDNIPIRMLYYNSISNFPLLEGLVTDYKKIRGGFFINKITYKNSSNNKVTFLEKTDVVANPKIPNSFLEVQKLIKNNINNFHSSFIMGVKSSIDLNSSPNTSVVMAENKNFSLKESNEPYNNSQKDMHNTGNNLEDNSNNIDSKNNSSNSTLLKALKGLNNQFPTNSLKNNSNSSKNNTKILEKEQFKKSTATKKNLKKIDLKNNNVSKKNILGNTANNKNSNNTSIKSQTKNHRQEMNKKSLNNNLPPVVPKQDTPVVPKQDTPVVPKQDTPVVKQPEPDKNSEEDLNSLF